LPWLSGLPDFLRFATVTFTNPSMTFLALNKQAKTFAIMEDATPSTFRRKFMFSFMMPDGSEISSVMQCDDIEKTKHSLMDHGFRFVGSIRCK